MAKTRSPGLEPFDRLEDKVKRLVALIERLRTEQPRAAEENQRLTGELDILQTKLADAQQTDSEVSTMREEREQIRTRVAGMLERLETIDL
ncbi:MAG: cell division protein ZapB [Vicinamibacterales bacterium]|nr:cell division protein ZapB [Vicinamibacterales bacterium]